MHSIHPDDRVYHEMLQSIFATKCLYFSYEYDLSNSFEKVMSNNS